MTTDQAGALRPQDNELALVRLVMPDEAVDMLRGRLLHRFRASLEAGAHSASTFLHDTGTSQAS